MLDYSPVLSAGVPTLDMIDMEKEGVVMIRAQGMQTRFVVEALVTLFMS